MSSYNHTGHEHHDYASSHIHKVGHLNGIMGVGQGVVGSIFGSETLQAASIHNISDWYVYRCRGLAAEQKSTGNIQKSESLRKRAQWLMLAAGFGLIGYEYSLGDSHTADTASTTEVMLEYGAMSAEVGVAAASLHLLWKRRKEDSINKSSWSHALLVDTPAAAATAYGVIGSSLEGEIHDRIGLAIHAGLLAYAGVKGLITKEELHSH